jgi:hypothetical protein
MRKELFAELVQSVKEMNEIRSGRWEPARVTRASDILDANTTLLREIARQRNLESQNDRDVQ